MPNCGNIYILHLTSYILDEVFNFNDDVDGDDDDDVILHEWFLNSLYRSSN